MPKIIPFFHFFMNIWGNQPLPNKWECDKASHGACLVKLKSISNNFLGYLTHVGIPNLVNSTIALRRCIT